MKELRDELAMAAMTGLLAAGMRDRLIINSSKVEGQEANLAMLGTVRSALAVESYLMADAMLDKRQDALDELHGVNRD